jgi:predicted PurR-regulated permease PerM
MQADDANPEQAMTLRQQLIFWLATLAIIVFVLWLLSDILLPFIVGAALAYLLNPLANRLQRVGVNRTLAALLMVGVMVVAFVVLALVIVPVVAEQLSALISNIPGYVTRLQALLAEQNVPWLRRLINSGDGSQTISDLVSQGAVWLAAFLRSLWSGGKSLISIFSLLIVTPVVAFYLICDWPRILATVQNWIPLPHRETVNGLAREIDIAIAGFLRGQTGVCLILGAFYAISLTLVGLNFGLLIGLISGLITFIPYVGSMTGLVLAVGVAVAQFWPEWTMILLVLGIFLVGQFVEGNILAPKLVGESIGLHPVWLMFAMFAFGYLFGFVGLLVAVPLAAAIGVLTRFALRRYMASSLYIGEKPG